MLAEHQRDCANLTDIKPVVSKCRAAFFTPTLAHKVAPVSSSSLSFLRTMSAIQVLRALVNARLSAAAEEILEAVQTTIAGYEEEILLSKQELHRQRRVLHRAAKPKINQNTPPGL